MLHQITGVQPMGDVGGIFDLYKLNKKYWPYQHKLNLFGNNLEVDRWCWDRFKGRYWRSHRGLYAFKREKDYTMFLLRWA